MVPMLLLAYSCRRIVTVLSQLSQAYYKAGNANAGNTYRKVFVRVSHLLCLGCLVYDCMYERDISLNLNYLLC